VVKILTGQVQTEFSDPEIVGRGVTDLIRLSVADDPAVRDEGTLILLEGLDEAGQRYWFGCDRRMAVDILHDVAAHITVEVDLEAWLILGRAAR